MTNGIDIEKIVESFEGRIGWSQPTSAKYAIVDADNQQSSTGRYFNDGSFHSLVTIENIRENIEDAQISDVAFNEALRQITKSATVSCLNAVFNKPELVDNTTLFERCNESEINGGSKFVGIRFRVAAGHILKINKIYLLFSKAQSLNLLLFHERKRLPIKTIPTNTAENETEIFLESIIINADSYSPGYFYLGYFQNELEGNAIDDFGFKNKTKAVGFDFVESVSFVQDSELNFDRKNISCTNSSYGLNADISAYRNFTDRVISNASLFDNAIGLQVAHNVAKMIIYSTRSNKNERILKSDLDKMGLQYELDGKVPISDVPKTSGLQDKINAELKKVRESFFPSPKSQIVSLC